MLGWLIGNSECKVRFAMRKVDILVRDVDLNLDLWICIEKGWQHFRQKICGEYLRRGDPHDATQSDVGSENTALGS
ncbi:hypothetical protein WS62_04310 [Burkholderia sp. ABCPW 14]|nr:hypothetical protein WS62_04310 [Burkholderia sp. ABCPW 14]